MVSTLAIPNSTILRAQDRPGQKIDDFHRGSSEFWRGEGPRALDGRLIYKRTFVIYSLKGSRALAPPILRQFRLHFSHGHLL